MYKYNLLELDFHMHIALLQYNQNSNKHREEVYGVQLMEKVALVHACLIAENLAIKSWGIDQSNMSKFSLILLSLALLGSTLWPIWRPQRRATWAGVFCNFSATDMTMGLLSTLGPLYPGDPGEPNGEYACNVTTEPKV